MSDTKKKATTCIVKWNKRRVFGIELEFNSRPPVGRRWLKNKIQESLAQQQIIHHRVETRDWERTYNNDCLWICKTDSSCGFEVCTPPLRGPNELKLLGNVCGHLRDSEVAFFDDNCGLHVHLSLADFSNEQMYNMLMYWIKIEHNVMHAHPRSRQENTRYCPAAISRIQDWESDETYSGQDLFRALSRHRGAINTRYWDERKTIEWRMGEMTLDPESVKNRIRFLIWFVDICKHLPTPENLNLFTPKQMVRFLGLWNDETGMVEKIFSPAVRSMRSWLLDRMEEFIPIQASQIHRRDKDQVTEIKQNLDSAENDGQFDGYEEI